MPLVAAYDDIAPEKVIHNREGGPDRPAAKVYPFFWASKDRPDDPSAFLVRYELGTVSSTHYHAADQMQLVVEGKGALGHHTGLDAYHVHFARAYTPYGPLVPDESEGWAFLTLRTRHDPDGAQRLSRARDKLLAIPDRRPWQVTCKVDLPRSGDPVASASIEGFRNEEGLSGQALKLAPGTRMTAPDPSGGDGQFVVALKGSFVHGGREVKALAVAFTRPHENRFEIEAGPQGLEAMVLNFPRVARTGPQQAPEEAPAKMWLCVLCAFAYDEARGLPGEGIAPGTRWEDVPDSWSCPDCGATKDDFQELEI